MTQILTQMQLHANGNAAMETGDHFKNGASAMGRGNALRKVALFFALLCIFIFGYVGKLQSQIFFFEGTIGKKGSVLGYIDLKKDSLMIILEINEDEIGAKHEIKSISLKEYSVSFQLNDLYDGKYNYFVVMPEGIIYGTEENLEEDGVPITDVRDDEGNRFNFYEFKIAVKKRVSNITSGTPNTTTTRAATYLTTNITDISFSETGGTQNITVSTDGKSYDVSLLPSWCSVSKSSGSFTLTCHANSGDTRTDWFKVKSDEKEARINVSQLGGVKAQSASIEKIWVEHNVSCGWNRFGMKIHVKFHVNGMLNKQGRCAAYFYFQNGNELKDYNGQYKSSDGRVAVGDSFKATYENSVWNDYSLVLPYDELHLNRGAYYLKFFVGIFDNNSKQIATSEYVNFTYNN
ncbi:MAG: BACON domain-containing protein [Prevotellaceae bacterium]|jgi:hypothetical protein|nr:BACON domain-containing protein [Prevotellaceae bacterium]